MLAEGGVVLLDIGAERIDPRRGVDHGRTGMGRRNRAREAVRERKVDGAVVGEAIERLRLVEAVHLDRPFDGLPRAPERQRAIPLARDRDDAAIEAGRKRSIGFDFGVACGSAPFQRREIQERKAHRTLDLVGALSSQEHRGRMGVDAAHPGAAMGRRPLQERENVVLGFDRIGHFSGLSGRAAKNDSMPAGYFSTASTDVTTKVCSSPSSSLIDTYSPGAKACRPKRKPDSSFSAAPGPYSNVQRACSAPPGL